MPTPVQLYRYDISGGMAAQLSQAFLGRHMEAVWHTAIVVFGKEFYFDGGVGVERAAPGATRFGRPLRVDQMGSTGKTQAEFELWVQQMHATKFGPTSYNLLQRNCNHFTQDAALFLLGRGIPDDITNMIPTILASPLGAMIRPMLESITSAPGSGGGGGGGVSIGATRPAVAPTPAAGAARLLNPAQELPLDAAEELALAIAMLESSAQEDGDRAYACAETLHRIVGNIVGAAENPKFRRVSRKTTAYASKLQPFDCVPVILQSCGFKDTGDEWVLSDADGSLSVLSQVRDRLADAIVQIETERAIAQSLVECESATAGPAPLATAASLPSPASQTPAVRDAPIRRSPADVIKQSKARRCMPLSTIEELLQFRPSSSSGTASPPRPWANKKRTTDSSAPRLLVCHDFKGGYQPGDDAYFASPDHAPAHKIVTNTYFAQYLDVVDLFVYFSHAFVTIPPREWIQCCHKHGVPIYGTLLIEHNAGKAFAERVLGSPEAMQRAVQQLVAVCIDRGFDGFLLNMESAVPEGLVARLVDFVGRLHTQLRQATDGLGGVVWYDALATNGRIEYQNALTDKNKTFMAQCGGIFTNYWWNPLSLQLSAFTADAMQRSRRDIFAGIDVFGRRTFGGGGLTSNTALTEIAVAQQSAALFAPGWTLESCEDSADFLARDGQFWRLVEGYFTGSGRSNAVQVFPFISSFRSPVAHNRDYYVKGTLVANSSWCQLSCQDPILPGVAFNTSSWSGSDSIVSCPSIPAGTVPNYAGKTVALDPALLAHRSSSAKLRYVVGPAWHGDRYAELAVTENVGAEVCLALPIAVVDQTRADVPSNLRLQTVFRLPTASVKATLCGFIVKGSFSSSEAAAVFFFPPSTPIQHEDGGWQSATVDFGTAPLGAAFTIFALLNQQQQDEGAAKGTLSSSLIAMHVGYLCLCAVPDTSPRATAVARTFRAASHPAPLHHEGQHLLLLTVRPPLRREEAASLTIVGHTGAHAVRLFLGCWAVDDGHAAGADGDAAEISLVYYAEQPLTSVHVTVTSDGEEESQVIVEVA